MVMESAMEMEMETGMEMETCMEMELSATPDIYSLQEASQLFDQLLYSDAITREIKRELAQRKNELNNQDNPPASNDPLIIDSA